MTELNFKGKEFVYNHHLSVPFRPLVPHAEKGVGPVALDGNLIVQGDNLHALKALLPLYASKVDCVYIDPPYNTGNKEWAYRDDVNAPMIHEWFNTNPISLDDGLRHDKWCAMMWPRLKLLDELLSPEGLIFISINSVELSRLKGMCDEVFGDDRYIGEFIWKSRNNKDNRNEDGLSNDHEYVLIYGSALDGELRSASDYSNTDGDKRGPWASANMVGLATKEKRPNLHYDLIDPDSAKNYGCPKKGWRFEPGTMARLINERRIIWPEKDGGRPRRKAFLSELDARTNVSSMINGNFYTNNGTKTFGEIMPDAEFPFPKPIQLLQFIFSCFERKDILVLDSFAGSGSTAHAVVAANKRDGGNRHFILVEMEDYADSLTAERVRRVIAGYKYKGRQVTELLRQKITWTRLQKADKVLASVDAVETIHGHEYDRIRKVIKEGELIVTGEKAVAERAEGLGGTFTYCTLGDPVDMDAILSGESLPSYDALASVLFNTATSQAFDPAKLDESKSYIGEAAGRHVWLLYRPDLEWLKSPDAALTLARAQTIAESDKQTNHLVFAPARYVSQKMLADENLNVEFAPLPFALYRVERT
ncbi:MULTISPECIES: site-specific DNA-methyltransferase [Aurantimonas]|uniref:site-specific DNA-methyltransferase n=1 Tax=Aurantimonas TaxID=182269 RepID=UPI0035124699